MRLITLKNYKRVKNPDSENIYTFFDHGEVQHNDSICVAVCCSSDEWRFYQLAGLQCSLYEARDLKSLLKLALDEKQEVYEFKTVYAFLIWCVSKGLIGMYEKLEEGRKKEDVES